MMLVNGIHTYVHNDELWFSLKDICEKFEIDDYDRMLASLSDWQKYYINDNFANDIVLTNEPGLYQVAMFGKDDYKSDMFQEELYNILYAVRKNLCQRHPFESKCTNTKYDKLKESIYNAKHSAVYHNRKVCETTIGKKIDRILNLLENNVYTKTLDKQIDALTVMLDESMKENDRIKRKFKDYRESVSKGKVISKSDESKASECCCSAPESPSNITAKPPVEKLVEKETCSCENTTKNDDKSSDAEKIGSFISDLLKMDMRDLVKAIDLFKDGR